MIPRIVFVRMDILTIYPSLGIAVALLWLLDLIDFQTGEMVMHTCIYNTCICNCILIKGLKYKGHV